MTGSLLTPYHPKGSRRFLQLAVNLRPDLIDTPLRAAAELPDGTEITWKSPLRHHGFREYFDQSMCAQLEIRPTAPSLKEFWPARGPRWDGLARAATNDVFLVEAKARKGESMSTPSRATEPARAKIAASLREVQRHIASPGADDWMGCNYQYANRLAHLHFLREQNGIEAHLVLVYFIKAAHQRAEYEGETTKIEKCLGVHESKISRFVHRIFVDVNELPDPA